MKDYDCFRCNVPVCVECSCICDNCEGIFCENCSIVITYLEKDELLAFETKKVYYYCKDCYFKSEEWKGDGWGGDLEYKVGMGKGGGTMRGRIYLGNAFAISMLKSFPAKVRIEEVSVDEVREILKEGYESILGHEGTAQAVSQILGWEVKTNRVAIKLNEEDLLIVSTILGRLPEGKILNKDEVLEIGIKFYKIKVEYL